MKYRIEVEVADKNKNFAEEFFKSVSFIKNVKTIKPNEITNPLILNSIEEYESGKIKPTPVNLDELKALIYA